MKIGDFIVSPLDEKFPVSDNMESAKADAEEAIKKYRNPQVVVQVVGIVRPNPVWDGEEPVAPAAPEAFRVGESVEALVGRKWLSGELIEDDKSDVPYQIQIGNQRLWRNAAKVRRPAAEKPFEFGQHVRVRLSESGEDCTGKTGIFMGRSADGVYQIAVNGIDCNYDYFKPDQVFPI